ncbi:MAG: 60S ribosomal protein L31 [Nitrosopumilus sp.]|nr:60S ribosomal protein L31 [Nitrosopumilus sp.]
MSNVEETIARIYTINFSKAWLTPKHKRTDRVVNMIKEFAIRHMKSTQIKIDQELNRYIWEKGKTNPPRKVRVRIVKDEDDQVIVSLYEDIFKETDNTEVKPESPIDSDDTYSSSGSSSNVADIDTTTAAAVVVVDKDAEQKELKKKSTSKTKSKTKTK